LGIDISIIRASHHHNLGKEGWELISTVSEEVEGEQGYRFFFKRESAFQ
jgi:hypothetical protein